MKLIFDIDSSSSIEKVEELNETTGQVEKKYKIKGIFSTINTKNRNGRIYPEKLWQEQVAKYQDVISSGSINTLMEYEHPARSNVDPMEAVAKINKLYIEGKYVMGEAVLLNNTKANQLKSLIDNGVKISVSSRGVGSVVDSVVKDFNLITYDIVSNPSDYNATMNGICESYQLNEGVIDDLHFEFDKNGNIIKSLENAEKIAESVDSNESENLDDLISENLEDIQEHLSKKLTDFFRSL
mgnify:CR=1 FL=1